MKFDKSKLTTLGKMIDVDGGKMCVYSEGSYEGITLVFLAGSGVSSPILEYKCLYSLLSKEYRIAVVEKFGYGFSTGTDKPRTVQNMVEECRAALKGADIQPPYALVPHSYSGIEAIYWANTYPDEVKVVLGLDMVTPNMAFAQADEMSEEMKKSILEKQKNVLKKIANGGILAKMFANSGVNASGMMKSDVLTAEEKKIYETLFYSNLLNKEVFDEQICATENARIASETGILKAQCHMFITDMKTPLKHTTWRKENTAFAESNKCWHENADTTHFLYSTIPDKIKTVWLDFLVKHFKA